MAGLVRSEGERLIFEAGVGWVDVSDAGRSCGRFVGGRFPLVVGEVSAVVGVFVKTTLVFDYAALERTELKRRRVILRPPAIYTFIADA